MVRKLADGSEEKVERTESIRSIYRENFATCAMSFDFAKVVWLQYLETRMKYLSVQCLDTQDELLKDRPIASASAVNEDQARPAASAIAYDTDDEDDGDLSCSVGLDHVKQISAKLRLRDFQDIGRAKKCKVSGTVWRRSRSLPSWLDKRLLHMQVRKLS